MKFIRVDCDYSAEGLWDERGRMIPVDHLPISVSLRSRIKAWNDWYSDEVEPDDNTCPYDWELHRLTAIDLARCLIRQLPDYVIVALDRRVGLDEQLHERVPFPGEEGGTAFRQWLESSGLG